MRMGCVLPVMDSTRITSLTRLEGIEGTLSAMLKYSKFHWRIDMKTLLYIEGQEFCYNCGERFMPDYPVETYQYGDEPAVTCPNPECNRGSWAEVIDTMDCPTWWGEGFRGPDTYAFGHYYDNPEAAVWRRDCYSLSDYNQGLIDSELELDGWSNGKFTRSDKVW